MRIFIYSCSFYGPIMATKWRKLSVADSVIDLAEEVVQREKHYRNVPDLVTDLIRQRHRQLRAAEPKQATVDGRCGFLTPELSFSPATSLACG
jgi:hypothetical protein